MKELKMEMNVGYLRKLIKELPDNMPVFVACAGFCNYDFEKKEPGQTAPTTRKKTCRQGGLKLKRRVTCRIC